MAEMLSPYASMYPPGLAPGGLPEEDEESLKNRLLSMGGSALGWLGGVLNKPGRAVRGAIGALEGIPGAASEMLNIIPYSDAFGITDPAQEVTGRKMLGLGPRNPQAGFLQNLPEDIAGFGAEVLTDPLTHISAFGRALTKGGQIAAAAGALPKGALAKTAEEAAMLGVKPGEYAGGMLRRMAGTLRPIYEGAEPELRSAIERAAESRGGLTAATMDKPLGGLLGIGPFAGFTDPMGAIGTGPISQAIARGTGQAADWLRYTSPMRLGARLFNRGALEGSTEAFQRGAPQAAEEIKTAAEQARGTVRDVFGGALEEGQLTNPAMRTAAEGLPIETEIGPRTTSSLDLMHTANEKQIADKWALGRDVGHLIGEGGETEAERYMHRELAQLQKISKGYGRAENMPAVDYAEMARKGFLKNVPGSSMALERMVQEVGQPLTGFGLPEGAATIKPLEAADRIRKNFFNWEPLTPEITKQESQMYELATKLKGEYTDPLARQADEAAYKALKTTFDQSNDLANWIPTLDPQYITGQSPLWNNVFDDFAKGHVRGETVNAYTKNMHDMLAENASVGQKAYTDVRLPDALKELKFTRNVGDGVELTEGALKQQMDRLEQAGKIQKVTPASSAEYREAMQLNDKLAEGTEYAGREADQARYKQIKDALYEAKEPNSLSNVYVPKELLDDMKRSSELFAGADSTNKVVKLIDNFTNLFKGMVYPFWPAARVRDFETGVYMNWATGTTDLRRWGQAKDLLAGDKPIKGLDKIPIFRGLNPQEATELAQKMAYQYGLTGQGAAALAGDITGIPGVAASRTAELMPGITKQTVGTALSPLATSNLEAWKPWNMAGVGRAQEDIFAPAVAGRKLASLSDSTNRIASWIDQMAKGVEPRIAAAKANAIHLDYSQLTQFERNVMRRVIPFYSWTRLSIPNVVQNIAERPGGLMGQSTMLAEKLRDPSAPPQVQRGIAIPVGGAVEGQQRYLLGLDLPHENILNLLQGGSTPYQAVQNTLQQLGSQLNPLAKLPIELATGKQLFSGRNLEDLYGPMQRMGFETSPLIEQALFNSPLARVASTAMTLADPRKYNLGLPINLLTGQRVTDVDLNRARNEMIRKAIDEQLTPSPNIRHYTRVFAPKDLAPNLTPEQAAMLQLYNETLQTRKATP